MDNIETSSIHIESHIKIWDPETCEVILNTRA